MRGLDEPFCAKNESVPLGGCLNVRHLSLAVPFLVVVSYLTYVPAIYRNRSVRETGFARIIVTFLIETLNDA